MLPIDSNCQYTHLYTWRWRERERFGNIGGSTNIPIIACNNTTLSTRIQAGLVWVSIHHSWDWFHRTCHKMDNPGSWRCKVAAFYNLISQHLGQNIAQLWNNGSHLAGSEYNQLHSTVSILWCIDPTHPWIFIQWDATQGVLPELEKNQDSRVPKTMENPGFWRFLAVSRRFSQPLETTGGLPWTTASRRTCRKPKGGQLHMFHEEWQICTGTSLSSEAKTCVISFF